MAGALVLTNLMDEYQEGAVVHGHVGKDAIFGNLIGVAGVGLSPGKPEGWKDVGTTM